MYRQETLRTVREQVDQIIALHLKQANSKVSYRRVRRKHQDPDFPYDQLRKDSENLCRKCGKHSRKWNIDDRSAHRYRENDFLLYPAIKALGHNM